MAKKLKETYRHTHIQTYRLPLVVLSAALQQKKIYIYLISTMVTVPGVLLFLSLAGERDKLSAGGEQGEVSSHLTRSSSLGC